MLCRSKITDIAGNPDFLTTKFYGAHGKTLPEDMVCFQQASEAYLQYYKKNHLDKPWKSRQLVQDGDQDLVAYESRLHKYLNRMYDIINQKQRKYMSMSEDAIYKELDKVIACQLNLEMPDSVIEAFEQDPSEVLHPQTGIPLVDIVINIDFFTAHFEDRNKIIRIVKELYNHCTTMKKLLLKHGKLILGILLEKYDKKCHLHVNKAEDKSADPDAPTYGHVSKPGRAMSMDASIQESREEFLAVIIGQLIRLYAKSKSMSSCFCSFDILSKIVRLMQHEQYIIQSDAQKTFDTVMKGARLFENYDRPDAFVVWVESDEANYYELNEMFRTMRASEVYSFKRLSMKLQFEILTIGLKSSMVYLQEQIQVGEFSTPEEYAESIPEKVKGPYFHFSSFFVDDKENLKDLMTQVTQLSNDQERIKEELFMLLSYFILTFEYRPESIRKVIVRNQMNFVTIISEFREGIEDEDTLELLDALLAKLDSISGS